MHKLLNNLTTASLLLLLCCSKICLSLDNGVALTPPMGWMTWQRFRCNTDCNSYPHTCIGEQLIRDTADRLVSDGWLRAGYRYVSVDDCWADKKRDAAGRLQGDPQRFPSGMKALGDYVHSRGLLFGIYADYGNFTCGGYPGSLGHLQTDATTFADWGVDYVKLDGCYSQPDQQADGYAEFGRQLNKTGRQMVYSCSYPAYQQNKSTIDFVKLQQSCSSWRIYGDIQDSWASVASIINYWATNDANMSSWNGPQHWNDADMLIVGNYGLSHVQQQAQMAMWCLWSVPLILSVDLSSISSSSASILQNPLAIAVNQDPLGEQGKLLLTRNAVQIWCKPMSKQQFAFVLFFNSDGGLPARVAVSFSDFQLPVQYQLPFEIVDIFSGLVVNHFVDGATKVSFDVLPSGGVRFLLARRPAVGLDDQGVLQEMDGIL